MGYLSEHLSTAVKKARNHRGLSQRDLSAKSGVSQAKISKFENGMVDLRISSLVALFRALGLELEPVPRSTLTTIQTITGNAAQQLIMDSRQFDRGKMAFDCVLREIAKLDRKSGELERLQKHMDFLESVRIPASESRKFVLWTKYLECMLETPLDSQKIKRLMERTERIRNQVELAQSLSNQPCRSKSAYSLEKGDEND